jgi:alkane 1-monooxygenase
MKGTATVAARTLHSAAPLGWQDLRYLFLVALLALPFWGHAAGASGKLSLATLVVIALIDLAIGDKPGAAVPRAWPGRRHAFYSAFLYLYALAQFALIAWGLAVASAKPDLAGALWMGVAIGFITGGFGITIAHELGHRASRFDRALSQVMLATVCYAHFYVEHNRGHHARVATPGDPASARLGESFYRFFPRTVFGSFAHAWRLEALRLNAQGRGAWFLANRNVVYLIGQAALCALAWSAGGANGLAFFLFQSFVAFTLLELVNYVEHYGLARQRNADGRYETVAPRHSWNSDSWFGNAILVNLQRHSDHHADSSRPYETLRSIDSAPQLPTGYAGMILLALLPPLWFRVMDPRARAAAALPST